MLRPSFSLLLLGALSTPVLAQSQLLTFHGESSRQGLGRDVLGTSDHDGDGVPDLIVSSERSNGGAGYGFITLRSGRSGAPIPGFSMEEKDGWHWFYDVGDLDRDGVPEFGVGRSSGLVIYDGKTWKALRSYPRSSSYCAPLGDVNKDGHDDFLLSMTHLGVQILGKSYHGRVQVLSGKDFGLIHEKWGESPGDFGEKYGGFGSIGDVDGDGVVDFAVQDDDDGGTRIGCLFVYSGATGQQLHKLQAPAIGSDYYGLGFAPLGDLDADGHGDFLLLDRGAKVSSSVRGRLYAISGKDGKSFWSISGKSYGFNFGAWLTEVGDWDRDGVRDFYGLLPGPQLRSGKTGKILFGALPTVQSGERPIPRSVGDRDQDGIRDLALGFSSRSNWPHSSAGEVLVLGSAKASFWSTRNDIIVSNVVDVPLSLELGSKAASLPYIVLGSASGVRPGIPLGPFTLALKPDPYFDLLLAAPGALIPQQLGVLDAQGAAKLKFVLPKSIAPSLGGMQLEHAAVVFGASGIHAVTRSLPLRLLR